MPDSIFVLNQSDPKPFRVIDNGDGTFSLAIGSQAAIQATLLANAARTVDPPIPVIANPNSLVRGFRLYWNFQAIPGLGAAPTLQVFEVDPITGLMLAKTATQAAPAAGTAASAGTPVWRRVTVYPSGAALGEGDDQVTVGTFDRAIQIVIHHGDTSVWNYGLAASFLP